MKQIKTFALPLVVLLIVIAGGMYYYQTERAIAPGSASASSTAPVATTTSSGTQKEVPVTAVANTTITLVEAENGKTITVAKGTRVVIALGEDIWTLYITPSGILNRIKNIATIRGVQGIYTADAPGKVTVNGEGRPNCQPGMMCAQYIKSFTATIIVK